MNHVAHIAVIGDLHSHWDAQDVAYFNQSHYESILVTGDLGRSGGRDGVKIARMLARLERDALVMLGNNDAHEYARIIAEFNYQAGRADLMSSLETAAGSAQPTGVQVCGYSAHPLRAGGLDVTLIAARPFAMGGRELSFPEPLASSFGVRSLQESVEMLEKLVDGADTETLMFFAHNGPFGLGSQPSSLFGRDFATEAGDWGDSDLAEAIAYAKRRGRRVLAVIAGHMHWQLRAGGMRDWQLERDGTLYLNAARVPRLIRTDDGTLHHHIALDLDADGARAREVLVHL